MRILYGVQGTGNGHLTRARSLAAKLIDNGAQLDFLFSGRDRSRYFDMGVFGDFACHDGLTFTVSKGQIDTWKTIRGIKAFRLLSDIRQLDTSGYDLVISDFEPITAWAAKLQNKTCVSMSHQSAFSHAVPKVRGYLTTKMLMKYFAPAELSLGFHYYHFNQPVLPPLIEKQTIESADINKIVVYMGFEQLEDIVDFLSPFTDYEFQVFAQVKERSQQEHIVINPISHQEFHQQLRTASGVISNAGFALSSECLALGKKLLIKPLQGQYEQISNALALQSLGRATITNQLDKSVLGRWLELGSHTPIPYPDVAALLAEWIVHEDKKDMAAFCEHVWGSFEFPYQYDPEFGAEIVTGLMI